MLSGLGGFHPMLIYISLELYGFKWFLLSRPWYFKYTVTNRPQVIVGTNGSGKSAMMRQLTPLPGDKNDFIENGKKVLTLSHKNNVYILTNNFLTDKHSFFNETEGVELNQSGRITIQRQLCKDILGVDSNVSNLMLGNVDITKMSSNERQSWFTYMSTVDYSYALGVYKRLKDKYRDKVGVVKHLTKKVLDEERLTLTEEDVASLETNIGNLTNQINTLIEKKQSLNNEKKELVIDQLTNHITRLKLVGNDLKKLLVTQQPNTTLNKVTVDTAVAVKAAEKERLIKRIDSLFELATAKQDTLELLRARSGLTKNELDSKLTDLITTYDQLVSAIKYPHLLTLTHKEIESTNVEVSLVEEPLLNVTRSLPVNVDGLYSQNTITNYETLILGLENRLTQLVQNQRKLTDEILIMDTRLVEHRTVCPKCEHEWINGFDVDTYNKIKANLDTVNHDVDLINNEVNLYKDKLKYQLEVKELYRQYFAITKLHTRLSFFWNDVKIQAILKDSPDSFMYRFTELKEELINVIKISNLKSDIDQLDKLTQQQLRTMDLDLEQEQATYDALESEILDLKDSVSILTNDSKHLQAIGDHIARMDELSKTLLCYMTDHVSYYQSKCNLILVDGLQQSIVELSADLSAQQKKLNYHNRQKDVLDNLRNQLSVVENEKVVIEALLTTLSPTEGLIAKGLIGFIRGFVSLMNKYISDIWLYPLYIKLPELTDLENNGEFNYQFPMVINDSEYGGDVKFGSTSIQEVINLAFRLTAYHFLRITDKPLMLDEFGHSMDPSHRPSAYRAINDLIQNQEYSQFFMISHYSDCFDNIYNHELVVIDGKHVQRLSNNGAISMEG